MGRNDILQGTLGLLVVWSKNQATASYRNSASCSPGGPSRAICGGSKRRGDPARKWLAFLRNHREAIVAFDFFTVPTATFRVLYCFFVIEHGRRRILHFNVTRDPTADCVVQQLRETFAEAAPYRYAILDRPCHPVE